MLLIDRPGPASASDFHGRAVDDVGDALRLWWFDPIRPALVLGSTQDQSLLRVATCGERGVDVVKRRSGGGLVYVSPEHTLWADVIVPSSHRVWNVDVGKASEWIGECWLAALMEIGVADDFVLHRGAFEATPWSSLVCFAGRGPGEIFDADGRKVLGVSQRRTKDWARFQCAISLKWEPECFVDLIADETLTTGAIAGDGHTVDASFDVEGLRSVLAEVLARVSLD